MNIPAAEYLEMLKGKKKPSKYHSKKTEVDGLIFDSKREADYYCQLKLLMKNGEVVGFCRQPRFPIGAGHEYVSDFIVWWPDGTTEIIDVKGVETDVFKLKYDYFKVKFPKLDVKLVR